LKKHVPALGAVPDVDSPKRRVTNVKTQTAAPRGLVQIQIGRTRGDVAGIEEGRGFDVAKDCHRDSALATSMWRS